MIHHSKRPADRLRQGSPCMWTSLKSLSFWFLSYAVRKQVFWCIAIYELMQMNLQGQGVFLEQWSFPRLCHRLRNHHFWWSTEQLHQKELNFVSFRCLSFRCRRAYCDQFETRRYRCHERIDKTFGKPKRESRHYWRKRYSNDHIRPRLAWTR